MPDPAHANADDDDEHASANNEPMLGARARRRIANAGTEEYVVKAGLSNALVDGPFKAAFLDNVARRVDACSKGIHRLSMAVNLLVRERLASHADPRFVELPTFLSSTSAGAMYQIIHGGGREAQMNEWVTGFLGRWNDRLPPPPPRFAGDANSYVRGAEMYRTNFRTMLKTTFVKRQKAFMHEWASRHGVPNNQAYVLQRLVNGWSPLPGQPQLASRDPHAVQQMVTFQRQVLRIPDGAVLDDKWFEHNYERIIVYLAMVHRYMTRRLACKPFAIAPVVRVRSASMHIDTLVLHGIAKDIGMVACGYADFNALRDEQWRGILRIDKYLTKKQRCQVKFTHTVQTDGVSVCMHFRRPKIVETDGKDARRGPARHDRLVAHACARLALRDRHLRAAVAHRSCWIATVRSPRSSAADQHPLSCTPRRHGSPLVAAHIVPTPPLIAPVGSQRCTACRHRSVVHR